MYSYFHTIVSTFFSALFSVCEHPYTLTQCKRHCDSLCHSLGWDCDPTGSYHCQKGNLHAPNPNACAVNPPYPFQPLMHFYVCGIPGYMEMTPKMIVCVTKHASFINCANYFFTPSSFLTVKILVPEVVEKVEELGYSGFAPGIPWFSCDDTH